MSRSAGSMPLRADAERNRQRLITAASALFSEVGIDAPLEEVARRAGVGIATLYRRFPTRADLVEAVFAAQMWRYVEVIEGAQELSDPWAAMESLVYGISDLQAAHAGLRELLMLSFQDSEAVQEAVALGQAKVEGLLARVSAAQLLRPDFDNGDLLLFMVNNSALAGAAMRGGEIVTQARRRATAYFLEGIRRRPGQAELPAATEPEQLRDALQRSRWSAGSTAPSGSDQSS